MGRAITEALGALAVVAARVAILPASAEFTVVLVPRTAGAQAEV